MPTTTELLLERAVLVPGQAVPLFEVRPPVLTGVEWAIKRTFDIVVSAILIILLAIPGLIVALFVRLTSPGPAIYRNPRVGVGEAEFPMLKFRSMYQDAEDQQAELEEHERGRRARSSRSATTRASRPSAASCGASRSTSCRSSGTCCAAR